MIFAGVDPGTETYAVAFIDEVGRLVRYEEVPTESVKKGALSLVKGIQNLRPALVALPSGHGMPFLRNREIDQRAVFLMTLQDPQVEGPLRSFLLASKTYTNVFTVPGVIELKSVPEYRKVNSLDMGTADKVCSAFFYRTMFRDFVLVEMGRHFSSIITVREGYIINGIGGTVIPGLESPGALDGEIAYLLGKLSHITKETVYTRGDERKSLEIIEGIASYLSWKFSCPIIVSGPAKDALRIGEKFHFRFKEAAVGAAMIANALGGGLYREHAVMLESDNTPISFVKLKGWEEVVSWIETL